MCSMVMKALYSSIVKVYSDLCGNCIPGKQCVMKKCLN